MFRILQSKVVGLFTIKGLNRIGAIPFPEDNLCKWSHTDIKVPNFDKYRRNSVIKPNVKTRESDEERKLSTSLLVGVTTLAACYSVKTIVHIFVKSMAMSADVQALAQIEVDLKDIKEGGHSTLKWRGKPLFLKHRSPEEIKACRETDVSTLRHPETDEERCPKPEWLIIIGVCTHLGCIPIPNAGDYLGGYYCPCHGSHYDAAGRIRKGPAPTNMEIPEHVFKTEDFLVVEYLFCNTYIWFNKECLKKKLTPKYINISCNHKSMESKSALQVAYKFWLQNVMKKWYRHLLSFFSVLIMSQTLETC